MFSDPSIDDRVPCGPDGEPIFCSSSDHLEAWPLLLEKAVPRVTMMMMMMMKTILMLPSINRMYFGRLRSILEGLTGSSLSAVVDRTRPYLC